MKKLLEKLQGGLSEGFSTLGSLVKVAVMSRRPTPGAREKHGTLIIMGNGPSLRKAVGHDRAVLEKYDLMSVNFAPLAQEFTQLKPKFHVMADGVFFDEALPGNVGTLWEKLKRVDWLMVLYVPTERRGTRLFAELPANITVRYFNLTPVEGNKNVSHLLFRKGLGMPRPRNVLIPAIMIGIREGYREIALVGADHSWSQTLWVTDNNRVVSVQPHFYEDNEKERERVESVYKDIRLHQIYESFAVAFRSYFAIEDFARSEGVRIVNCTPGSFIDAFPRQPLSEL